MLESLQSGHMETRLVLIIRMYFPYRNALNAYAPRSLVNIRTNSFCEAADKKVLTFWYLQHTPMPNYLILLP